MAITGSQKAYTYALSNVMRSGAGRSGYVSAHAFISVGGVQVRGDVALESLTITDELDETANRCTFRLIDGTATTGQEVIITQGSVNNGERLYAGHVLDVQQSYWQKPVNMRSDVSCVDYTWQLGFVKVTERYTNLYATTIVEQLIARYAAVNGFTARSLAPNLPVVSEITYTNEDLTDALTRLARRIGAYWYVDYHRDVHMFYTEPDRPAPRPLTPTHPSLAHVVQQTDRSQALTRVYVEGRGSRVLTEVATGDTMIPLDAVDMFAQVATDVFLKASFQGSDGGAQHLLYTGVVPGGGGAIVGPGIAPTSSPIATVTSGAGVDVGTHDYAYTWVTASGETKPSPVGTVTHGAAVTAPTVATTVRHDDGSAVDEWTAGAWKPGDTVEWAYSWAIENTYVNSTPLSPIVSIVAQAASTWFHSPGQSAKGLRVTVRYTPDARVKWVYLWHRVNGGAWRVWNYGEPVGTGITNFPNLPPPWEQFCANPDVYSDVQTPSAGSTVYQRTSVSGIAVGPATVTARKLYRTAANAAQLKLLQTLANNTATTAADAAADSTLGANAPTADTSALPQPTGVVAPGDTVVTVTSTASFLVNGGWAIIGNGDQFIRYTSLSGNTLTGIPATGVGAVTAAVSYGSTITQAAMLVGIPATGPNAIRTRTLSAGDEIYLVVQVDDPARQAQLAAMGGNGIREEWEQDRRLSINEARARGAALLQLRMLDQVRVTYTCRDTSTASGKDITASLPAPTNLTGTFKIQRVTINNFRPYPDQYPTYTVEASSSRFSFEDLLRLVKTRE